MLVFTVAEVVSRSRVSQVFKELFSQVFKDLGFQVFEVWVYLEEIFPLFKALQVVLVPFLVIWMVSL